MIKHRLHTCLPTGRDLKKPITQIIILISSFWFLASLSFAQPISSIELINNAKQYDGKTVVYEGEVIGDVMKRGDYAWLNINDGQNAIGIWMNASLAQNISYTGSYKSKGDWAEITGIFNRACPEHGGDLDIHAQGLRKISSGRILVEQSNLGKRNTVLVLAGFLCLILILRQLIRR